jgi:hypothetical protein
MIDTEDLACELAVRDRVVVQTDGHVGSVPFETMLLRICPTELWLGLALPDRRLETMRANEPVELTIAREGAALLGRSAFLRPLGGGRSRVFAVVRPGLLERAQRRGYVRYPIDLPVRVRHIDPATWEPRGKGATTVTQNLSPGGLLFMSRAGVEVGEDLNLTLPLGGDDRISADAVVRRVERPAESGELGQSLEADRDQVAVKFTRISSLDRDRIVRLILQTEHRRRLGESYQPQA